MKAEARRIGFLLAAATLLLLLAYQLPGDVFLDIGPNSFRYLRGFREDFEMDGATYIHWTRPRAEVSLPFLIPRGPIEIAYRFKRHMEAPADIRVFAAGVAVDRFTAAGQDFAVRRAILAENPAPWSVLELAFLSSSTDPRPLGVALDWLQVVPPARFGPLLPAPASFGYLLAAVLGLYAFPRFFGFSARAALGLALLGSASLTIWIAIHKLAPLHAVTALGLRPHLLGLAAVVFFRARRRVAGSAFAHPQARWALLACYLGTTARLLALFHSEFYYPDVRTHSKFVSLIWTEGLSGFLTNHIENQHRLLLGLQLVGDRWLAFPYPPLLYLTVYPLSRLQLPVEDWMKIVPATLAGVEALFVFAMALRLSGSTRSAVAACFLHATAPVLAFRLTVASYAALFGHFWDVVIGYYLLSRFARMERLAVGLGLALLVAASILSYAGSALVLGLALPAFALAAALRPKEPFDRGRAARVAAWSLAGALLALGLFYVQYVPELLPGLVAAGSPSAAGPPTEPLVHPQLSPGAALAMTWHRLILFYGPVFGPLTLAALALRRGGFPHPLASPLAFGVGFAFLGLNFLRAGLGPTHIFQFTKDDLLLLPLACMVLGNLGAGNLERTGWRRLVAGALFAGWIGWGGFALVRDVRLRFIRPDYPPISARSAHHPLSRWGPTPSAVAPPAIAAARRLKAPRSRRVRPRFSAPCSGGSCRYRVIHL